MADGVSQAVLDGPAVIQGTSEKGVEHTVLMLG